MGKKISSFAFLNITQFLGVVNDNLFKLLLIFFLLRLQGDKDSALVLSLAGGIFVIPFLLFSIPSGVLADRCSKRQIIIWIKVIEVGSALVGLVSFLMGSSIGLYSALFLLATSGAILGPSKYGIVPELVKEKEISQANGYLSSATFLAIIIGTSAAGPLVQLLHFNFGWAGLFCVVIAFLGLATSFFIHRTMPAGGQAKITCFFLPTIFKGLKKAGTIPRLRASIFGSAFFLFIGGFTQLNVIPFSVHCLQLTDVEGSYLFLICAVGIGLGSLLAGRLSKERVRLDLVPIGIVGVSLCLLVLAWCPSFWAIIVALLFLGAFGGLYLVPQDSYIQAASPQEDRGQNVAINNFFGFVGVLIASFLIYLFGQVWQLSPMRGFLLIGVLSFLFAGYITYQLQWKKWN